MAPRTRSRVLLACAAVVVAVLVAVAHAALPQQSGTVDLATQFNVRIDGATAGDVFGEHVASAGDFNGDGFGDVVITNEATSFAWIVFGSAAAPGTVIDLASPGQSAIKISNTALFTSTGRAGDVNGDGLGDVIFGDDQGNGGTGEAYVVFGSRTPADVDVSSLGSQG